MRTSNQPNWRAPLLANLLLALAYLATGRLGLQLAIGGSYASPLFLPAGIALAAVYTLGPRVLPGVALGSLGVNLIPLGNGMPVDGVQALAALAAAASASLQAWTAMLVLRRLVQPAVGAGRDVLGFMLLTPVLATISCTLAVGATVLLGRLPAAEMAITWFTWWLGDTTGILLAAPLTWIAIGRPRPLWLRRRWLVGLPLLLSAAVFIVIYFQVEHWENAQQMQTFRLKSQQAGDLLQAQFSEHERFIYALSRALGDPRRAPSADDFRNLASGYLDKRPELLSMMWLKPVTREQRPGFEAWGRRYIEPGFEIRDGGPGGLKRAPERAQHMVSTYIEPAASRRYAGVDFLGEPLRAETVRQALRSGQPSATAPLKLFRQSQRGLLLMQAAYAGGSSAEPAGMLLISMHVESYVERALLQVNFPALRVRLDDISDGTPLPLHDQLGRPPRRGDAQRALSFGGRHYLLTLAPTAAYAAQQRGWQSWTVLTCGLLLTALLGGMMLLISGERAQIQAQVKDSTARLREREARLQAILDKAADAILTLDRDGVLLSANGAAGRLFGYAPERMPGLPLSRLLPLPPGQTAAGLLRGVAGGASHEHEATGWRGDGSAFPLAVSVSEVELPDEHLFVAILHDLTEQRRAQERIHRLAHHDPLTGLDNRLSLNLRLDQTLAQARRGQGMAAVMFIDLDHFKKINDTHGHQTGDLLLQAVANRLREMLREVDTIARLGGDEFIIVTADGVTPDTASQIAVRIVEALSAPFALQGTTVHSGASVGVAMYPADGEDSATLLRHADTAMYAAKSQGRGNFQFFSSDMNAATHERLLLESRLWRALEQEEFELHLQAQVELASGAIIGAEALLRWHHPELGTVGPDRFIPIAEESGLILPLGDWVLRQAVRLLVRWREQGLGHLRLAVNLSARQCHGGGLLPLLDGLLAEMAGHGIAPALLELEITESAAMRDPESSRALLRELRSRGLKVAIDDFGTGYSSLSYLKLFELDRIKIDRGFVKDIESDPNDAVIVAATIALAHTLRLQVIAEGVETAAQRDFLSSKGCDEAQGYLFARPLPVERFEALARGNPTATAEVRPDGSDPTPAAAA
ncbi:EAL domain-containing protein [Pseudoduganella namucuonensis]|uniref:PAS domain S-box-containing protein/diguanylate cyclase (GGDEF) domain-containing protein n=1 Tax=Pseudoduganella namucuonensis TaxID=1035707 RepID=A0A1I7LK63_9BURK|nr:EAL domain-containing protein [Pseudoduganella namucuonensis]SFV10082.1 PAS domain S-box-containing protein/diguanylate cyclase (GGDEF) domain-containing protein [Pseudoduganella namucuonensis]